MEFTMQLELFATEDSPLAIDITIRSGHVGPIRFAASLTSYPHLRHALTALMPSDEFAIQAKEEP
jgi:hypothetical protein